MSDTIFVMIQNTGDLGWTPNIPKITPNDGAFTILSFDTSSITPGRAKILTVQFSPIFVGKDLAKITFPNAGPCGNDLTINLSGEGGCAVLTYNTPSIPIIGGNEKVVFTWEISNSGNISWSHGPLNIIGNGGACFEVSSITPDQILPAAKATITLTFHPPFGADSCCATFSFPNSSPCGNVVSINICGYTKERSVVETLNSEGFTLDQNFPNPFMNRTSFSYTTPIETEVSISLNDLNGNLLITLTKGIVSAGKHLVSFDASNLPSGTYIYTLQSGAAKLSRVLILAK